MGNFIIQDQWENQEQDGGHHPEGHFTSLEYMMMEKTSRRQRRMEASPEGGQAPEGPVAP